MPITPKTGSLFHAETQNVHHERVCAMQRHTLSVTRIQSHEGFTAHELCWPARKSIPKLEHRIGSDRVEVVITVDKACQALPNDVKERIERGKRSIGRVTHRSTPVFGTPTLTRTCCQLLSASSTVQFWLSHAAYLGRQSTSRD